MGVMLFLSGLVCSYLLGSIPFGYLIVKIANGKDVRKVESGRTGGTNVMRAAGLFAGVVSALLDVLKGAASGWIAGAILPGNVWLHMLAAVSVIIGHNYSIFLVERKLDGKLKFRGGAGGATCLGGAISVWPGAWIIAPLALVVFFFIGYASLATISIGFFAILIFVIRFLQGSSSWIYIFYGLTAEAILLWALKPNIKRLKNGTERVVGLRAIRLHQLHDKLGLIKKGSTHQQEP
jgi:glycerol-3-phosphate acyltransferase PlsY